MPPRPEFDHPRPQATTIGFVSHFGEALRRERQRRGEKQRDTALRFNVSQPSYHRWESGESIPADEHRHEVAEFLGVTVQDVWEMIHEKAPPASLDALQAEMAGLKRDLADLRSKFEAIANSLTNHN